jgi:hypothetical protein
MPCRRRASADSGGAAAGVFRAIAHPVCGLHQRCREARLEVGGDAGVVHRAAHALEPLVALADADRKRQVARAEVWVAEALDVVLRAAEPAAQEPEQLVARVGEIGGVQRADRGVRRFAVHQLVEAVDQRADAILAADEFERCRGGVLVRTHRDRA